MDAGGKDAERYLAGESKGILSGPGVGKAALEREELRAISHDGNNESGNLSAMFTCCVVSPSAGGLFGTMSACG